jgi:hypothetical protein
VYEYIPRKIFDACGKIRSARHYKSQGKYLQDFRNLSLDFVFKPILN